MEEDNLKQGDVDSQIASSREAHLDRADETIVNSFQLISKELNSCAKSLKYLKKEREKYVKCIAANEKKASETETKLNGIKNEILLVPGEVDQYKDAVAQKEEEFKNLCQRTEQEKADIKAIIKERGKEIMSLEQLLENLRQSRYSPLHKDPYFIALLPLIAEESSENSLAELLSQYKSQKEDAPSLLEHPEHESSINIVELLGLEQIPADDDFNKITTELSEVFSGILSSLIKVLDYYKKEDDIIKQMERFTKDNEEDYANLAQLEPLIVSAKEEITRCRSEYRGKEAYLKKLIKCENKLEKFIKRYHEWTDRAQEGLEKTRAMRNSLIREYRLNPVVQSVLPNMLKNGEEIEELLPPELDEMLAGGDETIMGLIRENRRQVHPEYYKIPADELEPPLSDLYNEGAFKYEGNQFFVLKGEAFLKYVADTAEQLSLLYRESIQGQATDNDQEGIKRQFSEKAAELKKVLEDIILKHNSALQQRFSSVLRRDGASTSEYEVYEENVIFDVTLKKTIMEMFNTLVYTSSDIPVGNMPFDLKAYFVVGSEGGIKTKLEMNGECAETLEEVKDVYEAFTRYQKLSSCESLFEKQAEYLALLLKVDKKMVKK